MTRYHYIITLQGETRNGVQPVFYEHGVIEPGPQQTRADLFRQILRGAIAKSSAANPVPLFFSLEPDELPLPVGTEVNL